METKQNNDFFNSTPEGLSEALEWAKKQPHTYFNNLTLFDELYDLHDDGFTIIHKINQAYKKMNSTDVQR